MEVAEASGQETAYTRSLVARVCAAEGRWEDAERHACTARRSSQQRGDASTLWRLDAIEAIGIPPIRFWLSNRRGDSWAKLRFSDTSIKWARLRPGIFGSGSRVDLFD